MSPSNPVLDRDNSYRELPTSYFTPTSQGWITYSDGGPVSMTATRWEQGTPVPGEFWLAGKDCRTGAMSEGLFGTGDTDAPTLTQWSTTNFSSSGVAIGQGCYKSLFTRAIWASDTLKPQVLTVKWDFRPEVSTVIPSASIGFTPTGASTYEKETVDARVRGQVLSSNATDSNTVPADRAAYTEHTGSGTTNTLDTPVPYGTNLNSSGQWQAQPNLFSPFYYALTVVRAVGS